MTAGSRLLLALLLLWSAANIAWSLHLRGRGESAAHADAAPHALADSGARAGPATVRRTVVLPAAAREGVLAEMRIMLGAIEGSLRAAAAGDTAALRRAANPAGMAMAADPALEALLPEEWMQRALATHRAFDALPAVGTDPRAIATRLADIATGCNSCHAAYRLETETP